MDGVDVLILLNKINYSDPKVFNLFCFCLNNLFLERVLGSRESFSPVDNFVVLLLIFNEVNACFNCFQTCSGIFLSNFSQNWFYIYIYGDFCRFVFVNRWQSVLF